VDAQLLVIGPAPSGQEKSEADQQADGKGGKEGEPTSGPVIDRQGQGEGEEGGLDAKRKLQADTIRYEITDKGILKVQAGPHYDYLEGDELRNFGVAVRMYYEQIARQLYRRDPATNQKLV